MRIKKFFVHILVTLFFVLRIKTQELVNPDGYEMRFSIKVTDSGHNSLHASDFPFMINTQNLTQYYGVNFGDDCQNMHFKRLTNPELSPPFLPFYVLNGCNTEETEIYVRIRLTYNELTVISMVFGEHPKISGQAKQIFHGKYVFPCDDISYGTCHQGTTKFKFDDDPGKQRFAKGINCGTGSGLREGSEYHLHKIVNTTVNSTHGCRMYQCDALTQDIVITGDMDEWGVLGDHRHAINTFDTYPSFTIPVYKNVFHCASDHLAPPNNTLFLFKTISMGVNFITATGFADRFLRDSMNPGLGGTSPLGHIHNYYTLSTPVSNLLYRTEMQAGGTIVSPDVCAESDNHLHVIQGATEVSEYGHLPSHVVLKPARYSDYKKPIVPYDSIFMATQMPPIGFQIVEDMVGRIVRLHETNGYSVHTQKPHTHKIMSSQTDGGCQTLTWTKEPGFDYVSSSNHVHQMNNYTTEPGLIDPLSFGIFFIERIPKVPADVHRIAVFPISFSNQFGLLEIILFIVLPSIGGAVVLIIVISIALFCLYRASRKGESGMKKKSKKSKGGDDIEFDEMDKLLKQEEKNQSYANLKINKSLFEIKYEDIKVLKKIGKGGSMSLIFKCTWENKTVAFKCFKLSDLYGTDNFEDFEKEVSIQLSMNHPNIIRCYGAVLHPPRCGIVLEYCSQDLSTYINANKTKIPIRTKFKILSGIINGLKFLHKKKLIHRDIKPENVLLDDKSLEPKLIDFGLSKVVERMSTNLKTARIGTSYFIAPEVVTGGEYNEKCDIFSFGMLMFELLTEKRCYDSTSYGIEFKIANDENFRPKIDTFLKTFGQKPDHQKIKEAVGLMKKCWSHDSSNRPNCEEIETILMRLMK